jgi:prepilin-type N-terminal cleavage/methylation domain-containing protein
MHNNRGFTLIELMTAICIIGILSALVVPNMVSWRSRAQFSGTISQLIGDLQMTKSRAIKENVDIIVNFTANSYTLSYVVGGQKILTRDLPASITITNITLADSAASVDTDTLEDTVFDNRGFPDGGGAGGNIGTVVMQEATTQKTGTVEINIVGRIRVI